MGRLPVVTAKQTIRALQRLGYFVHHQRGSHVYLKHSARTGMVTVPFHGGDLKRDVLASILDQAGLKGEEFESLL